MLKYSKTQINKAGKVLKEHLHDSILAVTDAENVLTYWRTIHAPLINTFQATLRTKLTKKYKKNGFIAQRLKRAPSIIGKLRRQPNMKLSTMQDIAGIRAVLRKISDVNALTSDLKKSSAKHKLISEDNYIENPKSSGYRSIHLVFQYANKSNPESDGLKIEVQVRSQLQHTWATAVETMGTFLDTSLKSSEGPDVILDFFSLTSSAFALIEKTNKLSEHDGMTDSEIFKSVLKQYDKLNIAQKLSAFRVAASHIDKHNAINKYKYYLITLDLFHKRLTIRHYAYDQLERANVDYTEVERSISSGANLQVVLVSIDKISALKKAYPNYFLEADDFIKKIEEIRKASL